MRMKTVTLALLSALYLSGNVYAETLLTNPNLPHPVAAAAAYEDHAKTVRNENVAKAGVAKSATQVRPVNGPARGVGNIGRPAGVGRVGGLR